MQKAIAESLRMQEDEARNRDRRSKEEDELRRALRMSEEEEAKRKRDAEAATQNALFDDNLNM